MINPDWYPDPTNPDQLRWWDGENWTNRVSTYGDTHEYYPETDYRRHGQIKTEVNSFSIESPKNQISEQLNSASIKPAHENRTNSALKPKSANKIKSWFKSNDTLTRKKKIALSITFILSTILTLSIFFITYQQETNFGKPTNQEIVELKDAARTSPNVIDARVVYNEQRECEIGPTCEPYRITVSGSSIFNSDDLVSLITAIAILKKSNSNIELCFSDDELEDSLQKKASYYSPILASSEMISDDIRVFGETSCTVLTNKYLKKIAEDY